MRSYRADVSFAQGQQGAFSFGAGKFDSSSEWFPIPYVAKSWRLGSGSAISAAFYGRGGMNTDWDDSNASAISGICDPTGQAVVTGPGPFCSGDAGVDLSQAFLAVNYAGKAGDNFSWGFGPVFAIQLFEATGVTSFTPFTKTFAECAFAGFQGCDPTATSLSDNGHDTSTGFGAAAGIWWAMGDAVSVGISYTSKMSMSELDDYSDLFADAGGFDIPASTKFGISFQGSNNVRLNLDIEFIEYSDIGSVGNPMTNLFDCPTAGGTDMTFESCLGGKNGGGFGWEDMTIYKLGVEWTASDTMTWRAGYSYGEQPIQASSAVFNILAPGVMEQHITFGLSKSKPNGGTWNFSLMYAPRNTVNGYNAFDGPGETGQDLDLTMSQFEFEVSYLW
jgi:long-chain fatty acid transport protein